MKFVEFQKDLHKLAEQRLFSDAIELIEVGISKGIREVNILLGFLAPLLSGKFLENDSSEKISLEGINQFTMGLIDAMRQKIKLHPVDLSPEVLFVTRSKNPHHLGIQMLELWLCAEAIATRAISGSDNEIIAEYHKYKPKVFGLSIAESSDLKASRELIHRVQSEAEIPPLFLIGGIAVKSGQISPDDVPEACMILDSEKLFLTIKTHLSLGFLYDLKLKNS